MKTWHTWQHFKYVLPSVDEGDFALYGIRLAAIVGSLRRWFMVVVFADNVLQYGQLGCKTDIAANAQDDLNSGYHEDGTACIRGSW